MSIENQNPCVSSDTPGKKSRSGRTVKLLTRIIGVLVVIAVILVAMAPAILSSGGAKNFIVGRINRSIDGKVELGDLSIGWFSGVRLDDVSFADNQGRTQVKIKQISANPKYLSLLGGAPRLGDTSVVSPQIVLNVEKPAGTKKTAEASPKTDGGFTLPIEQMKLQISDGSAVVNLKQADKTIQSVEFRNITSKVELDTGKNTSDFNLALAVGDGAKEAKVVASGNIQAGKQKGWSLGNLQGSVSVKIDSLELSSLRPVIALSGNDFDASGQLNADINAEIAGGTVKKVKAEAQLDNFKQTVGDKVTVLTEPVKLSAQVEPEGQNVKIDKLEVTSGFCRLSCTGGLDRISYNVSAQLKPLRDFLGQFSDMGGYVFAGEFNSTGTVQIEKEKIKLTGTGRAEKFALSKGKDSMPVMNITADFDISADTKQQTAVIQALKINSEPVQLAVNNGTIGWGKDSRNNITVDAKADIARTIAAARFFAALPQDIQAGGSVDASVKLAMEPGRCSICTDKASINNIRVSKGQQVFEEKLITIAGEVVLDLVNKNIEQVKGLRIDSEHIKVKADLTQATTGKGGTLVDGQMSAQCDMAEITKIAGSAMPDGVVLKGRGSCDLKLHSDYPISQAEKFRQSLTAQSQMSIDGAEYMGFKLGATTVPLQAKAGILNIGPMSAPLNDGKINFSGSLNYDREPMYLTIDKPVHMIDNIKLNDVLSQRLMRYIAPIFSNAVNVRGQADFSCEELKVPLKGGSKNDIVILGTVAVKNTGMESSGFTAQMLEALNVGRGFEMGIAPTRFTVRNGRVSYDNMLLDIGGRTVSFAGSIGLDKSLDMTVNLPREALARLAKVGSLSIEELPLSLKGTVDHPKLDIEKLLKTATEQVIKGQIDKQINRGLEKSPEIKEGIKILEGILKK